ncbi:MAG: hypothetical protein R2911_05595 [Caldilineaceae bacterium]
MSVLAPGDIAAAQALVTALADYRVVKERFGYMPFMWVRVGLAHGEFALAQGACEQVIGLMDALYSDLCEAGIWYLRADVLHLKGRALLGMGNVEEAHEVLQSARCCGKTWFAAGALADLAEPGRGGAAE